jgi:hypothetical protein
MEDMISRDWEDLVGRVGGPLTFRLVIQPTVPVILAIRAGLEDATGCSLKDATRLRPNKERNSA